MVVVVAFSDGKKRRRVGVWRISMLMCSGLTEDNNSVLFRLLVFLYEKNFFPKEGKGGRERSKITYPSATD